MHRKFEPILTLEETRTFKAHKILQEEKEYEIEEMKREVLEGLETEPKKEKKKTAKTTKKPGIVQSAKLMIKEKEKIMKANQQKEAKGKK